MGSVEYLVRGPDGSDYDHGTDYSRCRRQADELGPGSTVHPLVDSTGLDVRQRPDGGDQVIYRVPGLDAPA